MGKVFNCFVLCSAMLVSGCSATNPEPVDEAEFQQKLNNLTGNNIEPDTNSVVQEKEELSTKFWPADPIYKMEEAIVTDVDSSGNIEVNGKQTVLLLGIQLTDSKTIGRKYVAFDLNKTRQFMKSQLIGRKVYLEFNPSNLQDDVGLRQAYLWTGDNQQLSNFNAILIKEGLVAAKREENVTFHDADFNKIEVEAIRSKKGIWASVGQRK